MNMGILEPTAYKEPAAPEPGSPAWQAPITEGQFNFLRRVTKKYTGIALADYKRNMLYRRVSKRLRALGLQDIKGYCEVLSGPNADREIPLFINVVTTNKTSFFREEHHFEHLANTALPKIVDASSMRGSKRLRIWSAGCSSGEEPYSIAMTLQQNLTAMSQWDVRILATDIDTEMVAAGKQGVYPADVVDSIPAQMQARGVETVAGHSNRKRMADHIRSQIIFKPLNLINDWPMKGPFDLIFCRNVVIYFDKPTQQVLFDRFADIMRPGSFMYIGHSESLYGITERFKPVGQSVYQKIA